MVSLVAYGRTFLLLAKVRIIVAVLLTSYTAMLMVSRQQPNSFVLFNTLAALAFSGMSAAIMNNLLDQKIDRSMDRTGKRQQAIELWGATKLWVIASVLLVLSLVIAAANLNWLIVLLILIAFLSYVVWYTLFLKRRSPFGVVLGGLPGAIPVLVGSYAISYRFAFDVWLLFFFMILWQPAHFWALALKTKEEYALAGVPVLPVVFDETYTKLYIYLYGFSLVPISLAIVFVGGYGLIYTLTAVLAGSYYLGETIRSLKYNERYKRAFLASLWYMLLLMLGLIVDILL